MPNVRYLVLSAVVLTGCLVTPDPTGPTETVVDGGADMAEAVDQAETHDGGDTDSAPDTGPRVVCDGCTVEARQCAVDEAGNPILEICHASEHDADCTRWQTAETCIGDQMCQPSSGCTCAGDDLCVPGEAPACPAAGVAVCVVIDGCARTLNIGREADCAPPDRPGLPTCEADSDAAWCGACEDGRECRQACGNEQGYACGTPNAGL